MTGFVKDNYTWILMLLTVLLLSTATAFNAPLIIMAAIAVYWIFSEKGAVFDERMRFSLILFMFIWVPILISVFDAYDISRSFSTSLRYLGYPLAGIFIIRSLANHSHRDKVFWGVFWIIAFWSLDALIQAALGYDIFGYPYKEGAVTGIFHPKIRLGVVAAVFTPVVFEVARRKGTQWPWLWLIVLAVVVAIFMNGRRAGWVMLALSVAGYIIYVYLISGRKAAGRALLLALFGIMTLVAVGLSSGILQERIDKTMSMFHGDTIDMKSVSPGRVEIWNVGLAIAKDHPINGVGARGFSKASEYYVHEKNVEGLASTHAHFFLLDVLVETGVIGVLGYIAMLVVFIAHLLKLTRDSMPYVVPWALSFLIASFPLNVNHAFYGSFWNAIFWFSLYVTIGMFPIGREKIHV